MHYTYIQAFKALLQLWALLIGNSVMHASQGSQETADAEILSKIQSVGRTQRSIGL